MIYNLTFRAAIRLSAALAVSLLIHHSAIASETAPPLQGTLVTLAWEKPVSGIYYMNHGKPEELKAYTGGFSMRIDYEGSSLIQFYSDKNSLSLPAEERPQPFASVQLEPELKDALLLFIPNNSGGYKIVPMDFSLDGFPPKSFRVFNFSNHRVVFALGDKPDIHSIEPNKISIIRQDELEDQKQMIKIQMAQDEQGDMRLIYRSTWGVSSEIRSTVFLLPAAHDGGSIQLRKFVERGLRPRPSLN